MGWNDHADFIDPADPDPGETLRGMADYIRDRQKYEPELWTCPTCGENPAPVNFRCPSCTRAMEDDRLERESNR